MAVVTILECSAGRETALMSEPCSIKRQLSNIVGYIRTSTDKQDLNNQKLEIFEFAKKHKLEVDDFIQMTISSRKTSKERRIDEMISVLNGADTLIVTELSRLGRSTAEVIG